MVATPHPTPWLISTQLGAFPRVDELAVLELDEGRPPQPFLATFVLSVPREASRYRITGDAVAVAFESMDADGNGTLDKDEFRKGFAMLTSDSARAEAERE